MSALRVAMQELGFVENTRQSDMGMDFAYEDEKMRHIPMDLLFARTWDQVRNTMEVDDNE